jgi:hypothetical protein
MTCSAEKILARRNSDKRVTYTPRGRFFSFAAFTPLFTIRRGTTVLLQVTSAATPNGSVFANVDDALVLTLEKADMALLDSGSPDTDDEILSYDIVLTDGSGFENWTLGGPFILLGLNNAGSCDTCGDIEVSINGDCVEVSIEGGNIGVGASVLLADLNAAVAEAQQAAEDATVNGAIAGAAAGATAGAAAGTTAGAAAGTTAGSTAGTAAANAVVAGKADIAGGNIVQRRTFRINLNERTINVLDYIPTNLHSSIASRSYFGDVSAYIQQAYDDAALEGGATVYAPSGSYPLRSTLNITGSGTVTRGDGVGATLFMPMTDYGDVFHAYPTSGPNIQGVEFHDFGSYTQVDTTSGNIIRLTQANNARIGTTRLAAHHGGVYLEGSVHCHIAGSCDITSDANFAAFRPGSHLLRVGKGSTPTIPAEIHIDSVDWRGQNGNNHLHHAVLIEDVDGLFMTQPHLGFCRNAISMIPRADDSILYSVNISQGYLDTVSENGLAIIDPTGSYTGGFGLHVLEFAMIYNTGQSGILMFLDSGSSNMLKTAFDVHNTLVIGENGIDVGKGRKIEILPGYKLSGIRAGGAANKGGIVLQGAIDDVSVGEGIVERGASANAPTWGIFIGSSVTNFTINRARIRDCLSTVSDNSGAVNKSIATPLTY